MNTLESKLQDILSKAIDHQKVFGTSFSITYKDFIWSGASSNLEPDSQFFIASTTKLYITGTVNQIAYPSTSFRLALKLVGQTLKTRG